MTWWQSSDSQGIKSTPFLAPKVIKYIEELIKNNWSVLEHGSGGSTIWFSKRCKKVVAIEQDEKWLKVVSEKSGSNTTVIYDNYLDVPEFPEYDFMLIDGEPLVVRGYYIKHAYKFVKPNGIVVLDNANRPQYEEERKWLKSNCEKYINFNCNEVVDGIETKFLVTDFFFLKGENENRT